MPAALIQQADVSIGPVVLHPRQRDAALVRDHLLRCVRVNPSYPVTATAVILLASSPLCFEGTRNIPGGYDHAR